MPAAAKEKTLTPRQRRFVAALVRLDCVTRAAQEAGIGRNPRSSQASGSRLLTLPHIQEALREETARRVEAQAPMALNVLVEVMNDPTALARDRVRAAEAVLDRGFLSRGSRLEATVEHVVGPGELIRAIWEQRAARLAAAPAQVIDVEEEDPDECGPTPETALPAPETRRRQDAA